MSQTIHEQEQHTMGISRSAFEKRIEELAESFGLDDGTSGTGTSGTGTSGTGTSGTGTSGTGDIGQTVQYRKPLAVDMNRTNRANRANRRSEIVGSSTTATTVQPKRVTKGNGDWWVGRFPNEPNTFVISIADGSSPTMGYWRTPEGHWSFYENQAARYSSIEDAFEVMKGDVVRFVEQLEVVGDGDPVYTGRIRKILGSLEIRAYHPYGGWVVYPVKLGV